ncbi:MAG: long-chain fatty acid--CoA ligase [Deltaproteobacteria bacterium]|nr:long-chain fatty acid--CoA ligase [Deltaproteobacteria bacterium]
MSASAMQINPAAPQEPHKKKTMLKVFLEQVAAQPNGTAARIKQNGVYQGLTWDYLARRAKDVSLGLISLGVQPGERVCILGSTRIEWIIADLGVLGSAAITVPIYQSNPAPDCEYIVNNCGAVAIFVEDKKQLQKIKDSKAPGLKHIIVWDAEGVTGGNIVSLQDLEQKGKDYGAQNAGAYEKRTEALTPETPLTIIYTSGTTGNPKGAVLSHANMVYEAQALHDTGIIGKDDDQLLFLPMAHVFAKILECGWFRVGHVMSFAEHIDKLVANMAEVRPTTMAAVPRVYEKMYARVVAKGTEAGGVKAKLFKWALGLSEQVADLERAGKSPGGGLALQWGLAQKLVFKKIRGNLAALFGGRMKVFVSGGAPLSPKIAMFFKHANMTILEGFGMTETSAGSTINRPHLNKIGTVGSPLPGTEVKIAQDGEILIKGPGVMQGYYGNPEATKEAIIDGWMHTGDIGVLDADGYLKITDRKKDLIITAGGKNVAPQNIENTLKTFPLISQIVVLGDKQKYLAALITLNPDNVKKFAEDNGVGTTDLKALASDAKVNAELQKAIDEFNATQASYQTIKKFKVLENDFSQETGELTPTLKVKRKAVAEKYKSHVDALFKD